MCARQGTDPPERIKNAPELEVGLSLYWLAFLDLTSCREQGYTEGPITWLTIAKYADYTGYTGDQKEDLFYLIQQMDSTYIDFQAAKLKKSTQK